VCTRRITQGGLRGPVLLGCLAAMAVFGFSASAATADVTVTYPDESGNTFGLTILAKPGTQSVAVHCGTSGRIELSLSGGTTHLPIPSAQPNGLFLGVTRDFTGNIAQDLRGVSRARGFTSLQTGTVTASGGPGNDLIRGGPFGEQLNSDDWQDTQDAPGNDVVYGGGGPDRIPGGAGSDRVYGQAGNDLLNGGLGADQVSGGAGADGIAEHEFAGGGNDHLFGGSGNDRIESGFGNDVVKGDAGSDSLFGEAGVDRLFGGAGNDFLTGGPGKDRLKGGPGRNHLQQ
jgi:Ca2+-binding RTX toxin-like protein